MSHDANIARRLAARFAPACWVGFCVRVVDAATRETGDAITRTPDHYLAAAWAPAVDGPNRWPEAVVIGSPTASRALESLLLHLPADVPIYLAGLDDVDAALAASILLAGDRNLEGYQRQAIATFIAAERGRVERAIASRYSDRDAAFERFRDVVVGARDRS
jgi:hypothetical protein